MVGPSTSVGLNHNDMVNDHRNESIARLCLDRAIFGNQWQRATIISFPNRLDLVGAANHHLASQAHPQASEE